MRLGSVESLSITEEGEKSGAIVAPLCGRALGVPFTWDTKCFLRKPI
jgi:hypothetical protein